MKVAIVYDRVNKWGGAEQVLLALNELYPEAPLYTAVYSQEKAKWARVFSQVIPSFLQKIPVLNKKHELLGTFAPLAFETFNFDEYDLVISVTSEAAKGIITKPGTKHICYCLTPTRYLWSGYEEYLNNPPKRLSWIPFYKIISKPFLTYTKKWDAIAANRPDVMVGISKAVQKRIKKYYGRDSELIFPPVDINKFQIKNIKVKTNKDYFLLVGRLVPYKKVDLAIKAFNELGYPLVIVGTGSEENSLRKIAEDNIEFKGFVKDEDLPDYYRGAKALIHPQDEDFGITPVEAQAAGCPVVAYKAGGALDTVVEGKTGEFFDKQTVKSLISAVRRLDKKSYKKSELFDNASRFSKENFKKNFVELIESYYIK